MIGDRLARTVINRRIGYVRRTFNWACSEEIIPPTVYHSPLCVTGLRHGRSAAKETIRVGPVPDAHVDAIVPFLPASIRTILGLPRITGMWSGELVRVRASEIETSGPATNRGSDWHASPRKRRRMRVCHRGGARRAGGTRTVVGDVGRRGHGPRHKDGGRDAQATNWIGA